MKKWPLIFLFMISSIIYAKVPFSTVYVEIEKIRYEGSPELIKDDKDAEKNADKLDKMIFNQKIWVDVVNDSYLMIEEPGKDNDQSEKNGRMKYKGIHYTLDYSANIALDETATNKIFDNYTSDPPDYIYYEASMVGKKLINVNGKKEKTKLYRYAYADPGVAEQIEAMISELNSSDMPQSEKEIEIKKAEAKKDASMIDIYEWIWVDDAEEELKMYLRKTEKVLNVLTRYAVVKVSINEDFDGQIFEKTLAQFKIKKM